MAQLTEIVALLHETLKSGQFADYCPNGLQVQGRAEVRRLVSGVTASQALIEAAIAHDAGAVLVHHGYFWKGEDPCVTGMKRNRLKTLLAHDLSLLAYHLPLDAHPVLGNNAQLARRLDIALTGPLYPDNPKQVGNIGELAQPVTAEVLSARIATALGRTPLHIPGRTPLIRTIGLCTGAAQGFIEQAALMGCDAYISGEISEPTVHVARETGIHYYAAGHHATERYGVQALGALIAERLGVEHIFIDVDNPV